MRNGTADVDRKAAALTTDAGRPTPAPGPRQPVRPRVAESSVLRVVNSGMGTAARGHPISDLTRPLETGRRAASACTFLVANTPYVDYM